MAPSSFSTPPFGTTATIGGILATGGCSGPYLSYDSQNYGFSGVGYSFSYSGPNCSVQGNIILGAQGTSSAPNATVVSQGVQYDGWAGPSGVWGMDENGNYISVSFSSPSAAPQFGPPSITWSGTAFLFSGTSNGADIYQNSGVQIAICGTTVTVSGIGSPVTGSYDPQSYQFNFNGNPAMQSFAAQDAFGNLLGTPTGLTLIFSGTQSGYGQSIQLANGAVLPGPNTVVYNFQRTDGKLGVKYVDASLTPGGLLVVSDSSGTYSSPVYRYSPPGGDFALQTGSNGAWPASNLYPPQLYVNGHYSSFDATSVSTSGIQYYNPDGWGAPTQGVPQYVSGQGSYHVQPGGETFTLSWLWNFTSGFTAMVSGSYGAFGGFSGTWDGGNIFSNLPSGLTISVTAPPLSARYGPPQIDWNESSLCSTRLLRPRPRPILRAMMFMSTPSVWV